MKKFLKSLFVVLLMVILLPVSTYAAEISENLEEACKVEGIEFNHPDYKESEEKTNIYLFYGSTCPHCQGFVEFLESIVDEYGKYFNLVAYETWGNSDNANLMSKVAKVFGEDAGGVPYIVIGDKTWSGYSEAYNQEIIDQVVSLYSVEDRYDVFDYLDVNTDTNSSSGGNGGLVLIIIIISAINFVYTSVKTNKLTKTLDERITKLENKARAKK